MGGVYDDRDDERDNLPKVHDSERREPIDRVKRLEEKLRELDGSVSSRLVPLEANDVGDVPVRPNPRACDLGYVEACDVGHDSEAGFELFFDGPLITLAGETYLGIDSETFIEDVKAWA